MEFYDLMIDNCCHQVAEKAADYFIAKGLMTLDGDELSLTEGKWDPEDVKILLKNEEF